MSTRAHSFLFTLSLFVAAPLLFGAKGGCGGGEVVPSDDECAKTACGPLPEIACTDGSSPYTGRCLAKTDGKCAWEPRTCPGAVTQCDSCAIPTIACVGGGAPYDGCELKDGKCVAHYKGCANEPCTTEMCGPRPDVPSFTCADGTAGGPQCRRSSVGACTWEIVSCPADCTDAQCGPIPPVAPCPGGSGPTVTCEHSSDGKCGWNVGLCPVTACEKVTSLPRTCATKSDCAFGYHQLSCCGSERAMGYSISASSSFGPAESACRATYPGCGCAQMPTVDDSGKAGSEFAVDCVSGVCTTAATKGI